MTPPQRFAFDVIVWSLITSAVLRAIRWLV